MVKLLLVSIVVPVYNCGESVETMLDLLAKQTYQHIEIVVVDDGSTDDSLRRCMSAAEKDGRIKVFHTENHGSGSARNFGIDHCIGDYVYFPDADDVLAFNAIEVMIEAVHRSSCDTLVFGYETIDKSGRVVARKSYEEVGVSAEEARLRYEEYFLMDSQFAIQGAPWNKLFSMDIIRRHGVRYPDLRRHQDDAFIARYMCYAQSVYFISDVLYTYTENDLALEWKKYPENYIDSVLGLYLERQSTVVSWNPDNQVIADLVEKEYICGVIKALELSFSPKYNYTKEKRKAVQLDILSASAISKHEMPKRFASMRYQRSVMKIIKAGRQSQWRAAMRAKIAMERYAGIVFRFMKRG